MESPAALGARPGAGRAGEGGGAGDGGGAGNGGGGGIWGAGARAAAQLDRVGEPSPAEAWRPADPPPSWRYDFRGFWRWAKRRWRETLDFNPIYHKSRGLAYVKRAWIFRQFSFLDNDLILGAAFGVLALLSIAVLLRLNNSPIPPGLWRHFLTATGAGFLLSLLVGGFTLGVRAARFINAADKAPAWEDLALTPLRAEHYLWAWLWAPTLNRLRHVVYAAALCTVGLFLFPLRDTLSFFPLTAKSSLSFVDHPYAILALPLSIALLSFSGMLTSLAGSISHLCALLNIGPRLNDPIEVFWSAVHLAPFAGACIYQACGLGCLIYGAVEAPPFLITACVCGIGALVLGGLSSWMMTHYLLSGFWPALQARRRVRGQKSWWRSLFSAE